MTARMTPERWQQVTDALNHALELSATERLSFLAEIATADPELHREVESLLGAHQKADPEFLNTPVVQRLPELNGGPRPAMIGRRLGSYQIVEQIGEGGMGDVYRAFRADDQYRKQVALKVIRSGQDSGFVVSRFKNERQILASLDHPNIARLLDGGTTEDGAPYFVMELIEGESITNYCSHHQLSTVERLRLFLQVCSAVQFAHQRLIIHRDIKPGNILVTSDGTPKLLDFGIAKILDPESVTGQFEPTVTLFRLLTPGYASPEQIKDEPITTATDVYSLGVVLYELLTGSHPHRVDGDTPQRIAQAVIAIEPKKPSSVIRGKSERQEPDTAQSAAPESYEKLCKLLRGDLDNVVLMALRKEPQRRYASVEQFAEDIRRHLANLPVVARQDTVGYRASKFITRHKAAVAAAAVAALSLVAGLAVTLHEAQVAREQAVIAREQRARAERRFNDVRKLANSLMFEIHDSIKDLPGATQARKLLVSRALEYLDSLSQESAGDASLQRELAAAYDRVGDVLGYSAAANLGDTAGAAQSYAKALAIREALAASEPSNLDLQIELADEYFRVVSVLQDNGDFDGALKTLQRALPFMQRVAAGGADPKLEDRVAGLYYYTGFTFERKGDVKAALQSYRQGLAIREPLANAPSANPALRVHLVADYDGIARMLGRSGQLDEAIPLAAKAAGIIKQLSESNRNSVTLREFLAESYDVWADLLSDNKELAQSLELNQRAHEIFSELNARDPNNRLAADNLAFSELTIGEVLARQGNMVPALQHAHIALTLARKHSPKGLLDFTLLTACYYGLGQIYLAATDHTASSTAKQANLRQARDSFEQARSVWNDAPNHPSLDALGHQPAVRISDGIAQCDAKLRALTGGAKT